MYYVRHLPDCQTLQFRSTIAIANTTQLDKCDLLYYPAQDINYITMYVIFVIREVSVIISNDISDQPNELEIINTQRNHINVMVG